jgi:hypothetical protein
VVIDERKVRDVVELLLLLLLLLLNNSDDDGVDANERVRMLAATAGCRCCREWKRDDG